MTGDPTVLGMINDRLGSIDDAQQEISKTVNKMDKAQAVDSNRLDHLEKKVDNIEEGQKKIKKDHWGHVNNKKKHYNQGYTESFPQRIWNKKREIGLIGIALFIIERIIEYYPG